MKGDVFGAQGDFITSPEISQTFGEVSNCCIPRLYQATEPLRPDSCGMAYLKVDSCRDVSSYTTHRTRPRAGYFNRGRSEGK